MPPKQATQALAPSEEQPRPFEVTSERWENHSFYNLYTTGVFSDCQIKCQGNVFKGHLCVIASSSAYFEKALCGDFSEGQTRTLDFSDDDWVLVTGMLKYMYGCPFDTILPDTDSHTQHICLYGLADRIGYDSLKNACANWLKKAFVTPVKTFAAVRETLVSLHETSPPRDNTLKDISKLFTQCNIVILRQAEPHELSELAAEVPDFCSNLLLKITQDGELINKLTDKLAKSQSKCDEHKLALEEEQENWHGWRCRQCNVTFNTSTKEANPWRCPHCRGTSTSLRAV
ncbi:hypothetical protein BDZ85DRAFT_135817 [Elsinoe ampelina]|uniref:BTB domain-containing protein n=1 Tax=Elsinoe ampelina TaxID=302913 RepID=A0A6A6G8A5_9PEZI|nr:hypothetical protein BDZ85DRAFT_135817 [Elsinoe ampelina]